MDRDPYYCWMIALQLKCGMRSPHLKVCCHLLIAFYYNINCFIVYLFIVVTCSETTSEEGRARNLTDRQMDRRADGRTDRGAEPLTTGISCPPQISCFMFMILFLFPVLRLVWDISQITVWNSMTRISNNKSKITIFSKNSNLRLFKCIVANFQVRKFYYLGMVFSSNIFSWNFQLITLRLLL